MNTRLWASALCVTSCLYGLPCPSHAQDIRGLSDTEQQALLVHLREAREAFEQGDYKRALTSYDSAYRIEPLASILFFRAQCLERLVREDEAIEAYELFLSNAPQDERVAQVIRKLESLRKVREERLNVTLSIVATPPGATVRWIVNGEEQSKLSPTSVQVRAGEVMRFDVEHEGYVSTSREFTFEQGRTLIWEPTLQPSPKPAAQLVEPAPRRHRLAWSLGVGVTSSVLLSAGGFIGAARTKQKLDAADARRGQDGSTRPSNYDALQRRYNWGIGLGWTGALGAVACTGIALFTYPWRAAKERTWYLAPSVKSASEAGVSIMLTF